MVREPHLALPWLTIVQGIYHMQGWCRDERRWSYAQRSSPCICRLEHLVITSLSARIERIPVARLFKLGRPR